MTRELHFISRVKSDLTPEVQDTIQKSKDRSGIKTAHGTTHTNEEATVYRVFRWLGPCPTLGKDLWNRTSGEKVLFGGVWKGPMPENVGISQGTM